MAQAMKRPFIAEVPRGNIVIDLTISDNEDAPPAKRQRSESYPAPKILPHNASIGTNTTKEVPTTIERLSSKLSNSSLLKKHSARDNTGRFATKSPQESLNRPGVTSRSSLSKRDDRANGVLISNGTDTSTKQTFDYKQSLSNGKNGLPIRPSPKPQSLGTIVPKPKLSRSPSIVDLETDSDRASKESKPSKVDVNREPVSSSSVPRKFEATKSPNFLLQNAPPIRFDPSSEKPRNKSFAQKPVAPEAGVYNSNQLFKRSSKTHLAPSPAQKTAVRVILPPSPASQQKEIIRKLKHDTDYIEKNPEEVSRVTGVMPFDDKDLTKELHDKVRQKKHQQAVDRSKVLLDLDTSPALPTTTNEKIQLIHPRKQTRSILNGRFENHGQAPLTFENRIGDRRIHGKFQFISNYVFSRKVQARSQAPHTHRGCSCIGGICGQDCTCLVTQLVTKTEDKDYDVPVRTYHRHPNHKDLVILTDALISDTTHTAKIFECGDFCRCPNNCINRVVQRGRTIPLQIFETGKYGFGVRSSTPILRGQFIDIYLGEVLTEPEVSKREAAAEEDTPSYIMSLDAFISDEKAMFYIDGENFGSVTRFVNHSCEPNCKIIPVVLPRGTKHLYYVAFFAVKDIPAGTELTIDYDPDLLHVEEDIVEGVVLCRCGSLRCRKRLWAPGKEKRGRGRRKRLHNRDDD